MHSSCSVLALEHGQPPSAAPAPRFPGAMVPCTGSKKEIRAVEEEIFGILIVEESGSVDAIVLRRPTTAF